MCIIVQPPPVPRRDVALDHIAPELGTEANGETCCSTIGQYGTHTRVAWMLYLLCCCFLVA